MSLDLDSPSNSPPKLIAGRKTFDSPPSQNQSDSNKFLASTSTSESFTTKGGKQTEVPSPQRLSELSYKFDRETERILAILSADTFLDDNDDVSESRDEIEHTIAKEEEPGRSSPRRPPTPRSSNVKQESNQKPRNLSLPSTGSTSPPVLTMKVSEIEEAIPPPPLDKKDNPGITSPRSAPTPKRSNVQGGSKQQQPNLNRSPARSPAPPELTMKASKLEEAVPPPPLTSSPEPPTVSVPITKEEMKLEMLRHDEELLELKNNLLKQKIEDMRKRLAYEKCDFQMSKFGLDVQIDGLKEDVAYLSKKKIELDVQLGTMAEI